MRRGQLCLRCGVWLVLEGRWYSRLEESGLVSGDEVRDRRSAVARGGIARVAGIPIAAGERFDSILNVGGVVHSWSNDALEAGEFVAEFAHHGRVDASLPIRRVVWRRKREVWYSAQRALDDDGSRIYSCDLGSAKEAVGAVQFSLG